MSLVYPELDEYQLQIFNCFDPKKGKWSKQDDVSGPACVKTGRPEIAERAINLVKKRVSNLKDGKAGETCWEGGNEETNME